MEGCILHGFTNKQHDGFLGHSYLCPWVNLGADTNNSDLKNNYSSVRVTINGTEIDSGSLFAGLIMGDHAKSGINTMFNTGTVVGVGSNVFGRDSRRSTSRRSPGAAARGWRPTTSRSALRWPAR